MLQRNRPLCDGYAAVTQQVDVLERELDAALRKRRARLGAPILRALFGFGGYQLDNAKAKGCALPPDLDPISPRRFWAGLQFNGNPSRCAPP